MSRVGQEHSQIMRYGKSKTCAKGSRVSLLIVCVTCYAGNIETYMFSHLRNGEKVYLSVVQK